MLNQITVHQGWRLILMLASLFLSFVLLSTGAPVKAAANQPADVDLIWSDVSLGDIAVVGERQIVPTHYRTLHLDIAALQERLALAPLEGSTAARETAVLLSLPLPDGAFAGFHVVESPIMAPELAAQFPEIKTYAGQGIDDPTATVRFDWTPAGFHAIILSSTDTVYIDPYSRNDTAHYISYFKRDFQRPPTKSIVEPPPTADELARSQEIAALIVDGLPRAAGDQLRTYRLAMAATGEYTQFHGGTVAAGLAAIVTSVNRVDGIYEREVAVRLTLIANNNLLVYTNPATDPYTNGDAFALLSQNQANIDSVIGSANYDVGHVFSTGGGGLASLGVPCRSGLKARGETGSSSPVGDPFDVDYVAHELGHQFGANHTFNGTAGACSGNRNASTAYEPGSGSTIMAYAGICGSDDLQLHSDAYFHTVSFDEIIAYTTSGAGNSCAVTTNTANSAPTPNAGPSYTIPRQTPFTLTGSATDANGDGLTYQWEEFDLGPAGAPNNATNPPFFRSFSATSSPARTFPRWSDVLNNTTTIGEILPNTTRALTFRLIVRDNRLGGGGVNYASTTVNVTTAAGPFVVTAPNTAITWSGGSTQNVTWNVANTNAAPVNCANVNILLSTDGGFTYPTTLASGVPNNGSASVTAPNIATTTARVQVVCANNIFFDISNTNFSIAAGATPSIVLSSDKNGSVPGLNYRDEDIIAYDPATGSWTLVFDGSDVGLGNVDVDGFAFLSNGRLLVSMDKDFTLGGFGAVDDADILEFIPGSYGANTSGRYRIYFDGSDVGLSATAEDVDAIDFDANGNLLVSVTGSFDAQNVKGKDEDLFVLNGFTSGANTSGTWALYFDGSDVALTDSGEDIFGLWADHANSKLYLSTHAAFSVPGAAGDAHDILVCRYTALGATTACTFSVFWNGDNFGFTQGAIDGLSIGEPPTVVNAADATGSVAVDDTAEYEGDDANEPDELDDNETASEDGLNNHIFLPLIHD